MKSTDNSTKPSSNLRDYLEEPFPSFMKALHCYHSDILSDEEEEQEENGFLNETFSKSSGNVVEDKITAASRFSDISSKSINKSSIRGGIMQENTLIEDESQVLLVESFGEHSNHNNQQKIGNTS
jgi:hypothetical protein